MAAQKLDSVIEATRGSTLEEPPSTEHRTTMAAHEAQSTTESTRSETADAPAFSKPSANTSSAPSAIEKSADSATPSSSTGPIVTPPTEVPSNISSSGKAAQANMTPICYLTNKLSAETRILIFKHLFGAGEFAKLVNSSRETKASKESQESEEPEELEDVKEQEASEDDDPEKEKDIMLDTAIFATNKLLHDEALETFYNNKVVRLTFGQLDESLYRRDFCDLVRNIEITDCHKAKYNAAFVWKALWDAEKLSRVKSVIVLSDPLAVTGPVEDHTTVREYANMLQLGPVMCTDIGKYSLRELDKVTIVHDKLRKMWPSVVSTPDDYDPMQELNAALAAMDLSGAISTLCVWAAQSSFRLWVNLADRLKLMLLGEIGEDDSPSVYSIIGVQDLLPSIQHSDRTPLMSGGTDRNVPLRDLRSRHDPVTLETVTEFLSANIQTYKLDDGFPPETEYRRPHWPELGEEAEGFWQSRHQKRHREYFAPQNTFMSPIDGMTRTLYHCESIRARLLEDEIITSIISAETIRNADKAGVKSIFFFLLAAGITDLHDEDPPDQEDIDEWALDFLRDHILSQVPSLLYEGISETPLEELRQVVHLSIDHQKLDPMILAIGPTLAKVHSQQEQMGVVEPTVEQYLESIPDGDESWYDQFDGLCVPFLRQFGKRLHIAWIIHSTLEEVRRRAVDGSLELGNFASQGGLTAEDEDEARDKDEDDPQSKRGGQQ